MVAYKTNLRNTTKANVYGGYQVLAIFLRIIVLICLIIKIKKNKKLNGQQKLKTKNKNKYKNKNYLTNVCNINKKNIFFVVNIPLSGEFIKHNVPKNKT